MSDYTFSGKDLKLTWNNAQVTLDSSLGANEELDGAGSYSPNTWFKNYEVKIYTASSGALRRTEYVDTNFYNYTYKKNIEDGTVEDNLKVEVSVRDKFGKSSKAGILIVDNDIPDALTTITCTAIEDGVRFEWIPSVEEDWAYYSVRTSSDNGSNWGSWENIDRNSYTRQLSNAEMVLQAKGLTTITIQTKIVDLYNNESSVLRADKQCLNQKPYLTIGADNIGLYGSLSNAISSLSMGGSLFIKNGTYYIDSNITISNVNLDITGESKENVKIYGTTGDEQIHFTGSNNSYYIGTLSLLNFSGLLLSGQLNSFYVDDLKMSLKNNTKTAISGNSITDLSTSTIRIYDNDIDTCQYGMDFGGLGGNKLYIENNTIDNCNYYGIYVSKEDNSEIIINNNIITEILGTGVFCGGGSPNKGYITNNYIEFSNITTTLSGNQCGIDVGMSGIKVLENKILINRGDASYGICGISVDGSNSVFILDNLIDITSLEDTYMIYGISAICTDDSIISRNHIKINDSHNPGNYGIYLEGLVLNYALRNIVAQNYINMVNNTDYGIRLNSGYVNYTQGSDNLTYNCGVGISNNGGSTNAVTGKDV